MNLKKTKAEMQKALQEALKRMDTKEAQFFANTAQAVNRRKSARPGDTLTAQKNNS
jgi:hypothetical protein